MFEFISKKFADIKILHEGHKADYFLNRMKTNALFPIFIIQNTLTGLKFDPSNIFIKSFFYENIISNVRCMCNGNCLRNKYE
jgi:hypothetical protein